jgi:hypothetical protein
VRRPGGGAPQIEAIEGAEVDEVVEEWTMAQETFTIDKVAWHTETPGNPETREQIVARFFAIVSFLQQHGLTNRRLASSPAEISDEFSIEAGDLTETGLAVTREAYDKWVRKVDKRMNPSDTSLLAKALPSK